MGTETQRYTPIWSITRTAPLYSRLLQPSLAGKANVSPVSSKKSFLFLIPSTWQTPDNFHTLKIMRVMNLYHKTSINIQFLTFLFPLVKCEPQTQPFTQAGLNCIKTKQQTHCFYSVFLNKAQELMSVLTIH